MQTILLKKTQENVLLNGKSGDMEIFTSDLIRTACNQPVKGGFSATDLMNRIRIIDQLDKALIAPTEHTTLELEDADYRNLSNMVAEARWPIVSKTILEFVNSFKK